MAESDTVKNDARTREGQEANVKVVAPAKQEGAPKQDEASKVDDAPKHDAKKLGSGEVQLILAGIQLAEQFAPYAIQGITALIAALHKKAAAKETMPAGSIRSLAEEHGVDLDHVAAIVTNAARHPDIAKIGAKS